MSRDDLEPPTSIPSSRPPSGNDLDDLLGQLDVADAAVRAVYRKLADDPDLAPAHETALRELHRKRSELAHQVGVAALNERRERRSHSERVPPSVPVPSIAAQALVESEPPVATPVGAHGADATPSPGADETQSETPAVPVSQEQLREFMAAVNEPAPPPRARPDDRTLLLMLATHVNLAEEVSTLKVFEAEVEQLERAATEDRQKRWREMTREGQVRWVSVLVAWAKALDQEALRFREATLGVSAIFRSLRAFSIHDSPGFIHGFARNASPRSGSWRSDASRLLREIRPVPEPMEVKAPPKARPAVDEPLVDEEEESTPEALADWALLDRVKGLRVVLLGGEPREERRVVLQRAFQFESLEWIPRNRPRLVASLAERAARGTIDFVLVTKFVAHKETEAIQRARGTPMLTMRHGYGVAAIRQVFEDHFARGVEASSS